MSVWEFSYGPILSRLTMCPPGPPSGPSRANHLGYGGRTINELIADINQALAAAPPEAQ